jgi:hypothetical protein
MFEGTPITTMTTLAGDEAPAVSVADARPPSARRSTIAMAARWLMMPDTGGTRKTVPPRT